MASFGAAAARGLAGCSRHTKLGPARHDRKKVDFCLPRPAQERRQAPKPRRGSEAVCVNAGSGAAETASYIGWTFSSL